MCCRNHLHRVQTTHHLETCQANARVASVDGIWWRHCWIVLESGLKNSGSTVRTAQLTGYLSDVETEVAEWVISLAEVTSVSITARTIGGNSIDSCVTLASEEQHWVLATKSEVPLTLTLSQPETQC